MLIKMICARRRQSRWQRLAGPHRGMARAAAGLLAVLLCAVGVGTIPRAAADGFAAKQPNCGFADSTAGTTIRPGAGGDFVGLGNHGSYRIFDSSSPVTPENHDRLILGGNPNRGLRRFRAGDHLVLCRDAEMLEVVIENHYCRGPGSLSEVDTFNNEIEEIIFADAREIWLTDVLFAGARKSPGAYLPKKDAERSQSPQKPWRILPFSRVLPHWRSAGACGRP